MIWSRAMGVIATSAMVLSALAALATSSPAVGVTADSDSWSSPVPVDLTNGDPNIIRCASRGFCAVVDANGGVMLRKDGRWQPPIHLDPYVRPQGLSCVSSSFCVAVFEGGFVSTYDGVSWTQPTQVTPTLFFTGVSCASTTFCVAIDWEGDYLTFDGSSWSDPIPTGTEQYNELVRVSCVSPTFCMASDSYGVPWRYDGSGWTSYDDGQFVEEYENISCTSANWCVLEHDRQVKVWDGSSWTYSDQFAGSELTDVSCRSASYCMAVSTSGTAYRYEGSTWQPTSKTGVSDVTAVSCWRRDRCRLTTKAGEVLMFGGAWSTPTLIDPESGWPLGLSCPSVDFCMGVDLHQDTYQLVDGVWSRPRHRALTGDIHVSCVSAALCVVVDQAGRAAIYRNGTWAKPKLVKGMPGFSTISCADSGFCIGTGAGYVVTYDGTAWSQPQQVLPDGAFASLSCVSATFCMGLKGGGSTLVYDGQAWHPTGRAFGYQANEVSCASPTFCIALDIYSHYTVWDGSSWSAQQYSPGIVGFACPDAGFCMGMGDRNHAYVYADGRWQQSDWLGKGRDGKYFVVDCASDVSCTTINSSGYARRWTDELSTQSDTFRRLWGSHDLRTDGTRTKRLIHPMSGRSSSPTKSWP